MSDNDLIRQGDVAKAITTLAQEFIDGGSPTAAHVLNLASDRINTIPAVQPTVKPLVWVETLDGGETCLTDERYSISYWEGEKLFVDRYTTMRRHPTLEAAKAAAQADYDARILSALNMQPTVSPKQLAAQPDDVAALVKALEWYISEDETNEGDEPMPDHGNRSWNEINSYWIEGKRKAEAALARVKGVA